MKSMPASEDVPYFESRIARPEMQKADIPIFVWPPQAHDSVLKIRV